MKQLLTMIKNGDVCAGERLPGERDLALSLSVTRTTVREALRRLENMGLVKVRQGDGIYVCDYRMDTNLDFVNTDITCSDRVDPDLLISFDETRRVFAVAIVELAAQRADADDLANLRSLVLRCPESNAPMALRGEWDYLFYRQIAVASKNRVFVHIVNSLKSVFIQMRHVYSSLDSIADESIKELNARLVDALEAHDPTKAAGIVRDRMGWDREKLIERYKASCSCDKEIPEGDCNE